ncbi:MAG: ATP-binding protein [Bacteroidales bacterium]|nr:ATP-binding protein [Bacteroidales bacterium]
MENPFVVVGKIPDKYFCDRELETKKLVHSITNGNNLVLISLRRMGKTGLIQHCYAQKKLDEKYYTFFVDILHTASLQEFTFALGKEIYRQIVPKGKKLSLTFLQTIKSIAGKFGVDPITGLPSFNIDLGDIEKPELTLEEIFTYLEHADKPCIVAIDEFQQIHKYPEKNIEALLRGHIQKMQNCRFIFAGSERSIMQNMFLNSTRPFYQSADIMELNEIPFDVYCEFITKQFNDNDIAIATDIVKYIYDTFDGHTFYIQKICNEAFSLVEGNECTLDLVKQAISNIIIDKEPIYKEILSNISDKQKMILYAIAKEGVATRVTSASFIKKHNLPSASSVQSAMQKLIEKGIVTERNNEFIVVDRFLGLWIKNVLL